MLDPSSMNDSMVAANSTAADVSSVLLPDQQQPQPQPQPQPQQKRVALHRRQWIRVGFGLVIVVLFVYLANGAARGQLRRFRNLRDFNASQPLSQECSDAVHAAARAVPSYLHWVRRVEDDVSRNADREWSGIQSAVADGSGGKAGGVVASDLSGPIELETAALTANAGHGVSLAGVLAAGAVLVKGGSLSGSVSALHVAGATAVGSSVKIVGATIAGGTGHAVHAVGAVSGAVSVVGGAATSTGGDAVHFDADAPSNVAAFSRYFKL